MFYGAQQLILFFDEYCNVTARNVTKGRDPHSGRQVPRAHRDMLHALGCWLADAPNLPRWLVPTVSEALVEGVGGWAEAAVFPRLASMTAGEWAALSTDARTAAWLIGHVCGVLQDYLGTSGGPEHDNASLKRVGLRAPMPLPLRSALKGRSFTRESILAARHEDVVPLWDAEFRPSSELGPRIIESEILTRPARRYFGAVAFSDLN